MDSTAELEAILPGVSEAYAALRTTDGTGIYTSSGTFYNHTFFGRDSALCAKFLTRTDHQLARQAILFLASKQGRTNNSKTQEQTGRIFHELRDFRQWRGSWSENLMLRIIAPLWGKRRGQLLTYFTVDTTALFIRLVHKYAVQIDDSILDYQVNTVSGEVMTIRDCVGSAADWIVSQITGSHVLTSWRTNNWSLPFQTLEDSVTAYVRKDLSLADYKHGIAYVEVQAFAADALYDAAELLGEHDDARTWRNISKVMGTALFTEFWDDEAATFASAIDRKGQVDMRNISAGWTLNTSVWERLNEEERAQKVSAVVRQLFSPDFLTRVGIRTRSLSESQVLKGVVEYHGARTIWPMFTFMCIEGLRRHRLFQLAAELETRLINGYNATGHYREFFMVDKDGVIECLADKEHTAQMATTLQMKPEANIAFSVVPAMTIARRMLADEVPPNQEVWQQQLENEIIASIVQEKLVLPEHAAGALGPIRYIHPRRSVGKLKSSWYFARESWKIK